MQDDNKTMLTRSMIRFAWLFSVRDITLRKFRSLLTILAISIGVASFVSLRLVSIGVHIKVTEEVNQLINADLIIYGEGICDVPQFVEQLLTTIPHIKKTTSIIMVRGWVETNRGKYFANIIGCDSKSLREFFNISLIEGRKFEDGETNVVIVHEDIARSLYITLGKNVVVKPHAMIKGGKGYTAEVIGISEASASIGGFSFFTYCIIPLKDAQKLMDSEGYITYIFVKVSDKEFMNSIKRDIKKLFPKALITEQKEITKVINRIVNTITGLMVALTLIGVVVAFFAVANTIMMNVREHVRDIGILKAVGARKSYVLSMFLLEAFLLSLVGGVIGTFLGIVGSYALRELLPQMGISFIVPIVLDIYTLITGFLLSVGVGLLASLYPSWRASLISPIEALKYE